MSHRWSFIKRFGRVNRDDFLSLAYSFVHAIVNEVKEPLVVNVVLYGTLPHSVTAPEDSIQEWVAAENKKKEFMNATFGAESLLLEFLEAHVSKVDFNSAANIQLSVRLAEDKHRNYVFGHMECKGLLPRHVVFYFQSAIELDCCNIEDQCTGGRRPSKIMFGTGDGFEKCHTYSLS